MYNRGGRAYFRVSCHVKTGSRTRDAYLGRKCTSLVTVFFYVVTAAIIVWLLLRLCRDAIIVNGTIAPLCLSLSRMRLKFENIENAKHRLTKITFWEILCKITLKWCFLWTIRTRRVYVQTYFCILYKNRTRKISVHRPDEEGERAFICYFV